MNDKELIENLVDHKINDGFNFERVPLVYFKGKIIKLNTPYKVTISDGNVLKGEFYESTLYEECFEMTFKDTNTNKEYDLYEFGELIIEIKKEDAQ